MRRWSAFGRLLREPVVTCGCRLAISPGLTGFICDAAQHPKYLADHVVEVGRAKRATSHARSGCRAAFCTMASPTVLRFDWACISAELASAIQRRLACVQGALVPNPLPARVLIDVTDRSYRAASARYQVSFVQLRSHVSPAEGQCTA